MKAGRPQGGPKGQSEQANALAVFLRNLTKDLTVRELADRYAGGKTLWGEYRSGTKTVHLHLLESLVHDTVKDARSRTELLAKARRLHAEAVAAQQPATPAEPDHGHQGVSPEQAVDQATTTLQDAERLIHILLGVIAGLQMQATSTGPTAAGPVPLTAAQSTQAAGDLREAQDRLIQVRLVHDVVSRVRDEAAAHLPAPHPTDTEQTPGSQGRGDDGALPARYAAASRGAAAILLVSRAALAEQHNAARILSARTAGVGTALYGVEASSSPATALPPAPSPETLGGPQARDRSPRWRTALVATAAAVALTAVVSGAVVVTTLSMRNHDSPQAAQEKSPEPAAPRSSPAPSLSPSPTATATPSPTPSTGPSSIPSPVRTRSTSTVPDPYIGAWEGEFTEPGEQAPSLRRIVVRKGTVGTKIADVITLSRTSLCQAEGTLRSTGTLLLITPRPTSGTPTPLCTPAGDIALRRDGDAGLTWKSDGITVHLHRAASSRSAVPASYVGTWWAQDGNDPTSTVRMTIRQGVPGRARAEFTWDGDAHHCEGFSVLASAGDTLAFGPETVTASEPEGFCTQTPSRTMTRPDNGSLHVEMAAPDGTAPRAFTFTRAN
ncbi:hypothetical protein AB0L28_29185 [Streptomyces sp. NPDC052503]|uniref:hypothetical protein n=1 Tax=Streptomyces sp. NPDC052503 TaxID=3156683 RepID=UPI00136F5F9F|nr:hypothetical protein [Streptomyces sp. SID7834]MYT57986.1 hypothetical protein [Streptomyces sp. SID7834]